MIFLHHADLFWAGGDFAVSFFFILSGYIITKRHADEIDECRFSQRQFLRRRIAHIYPIHIICLALFALFIQTDFSFASLRHLFLNFMLVQSWFAERYIFFSGNSISWFLSDIMFCYLLFPVLYKFFRRQSATILLLVIYFILINLLPDKIEFWAVYISPLSRWIDFVLGIAMAQTFRNYKKEIKITSDRKTAFLLASLCEFTPIAVSYIAVMLCQVVDYLYVMASYWWLPSAMFIIIFSLNDNGGGIVTRILHWKPLLYFGSLSFYFFMIHFIVIRIILKYFPESDTAVESYLKIFIMFMLTLILSILVKRLLHCLPSVSVFWCKK